MNDVAFCGCTSFGCEGDALHETFTYVSHIVHVCFTDTSLDRSILKVW